MVSLALISPNVRKLKGFGKDEKPEVGELEEGRGGEGIYILLPSRVCGWW